MLQTFVGLFIEILYTVGFSTLGMALLPLSLGKNGDDKTKKVSFLISPIIGFAVWLGVSLSIGMFSYNKISLVALLTIAILFVLYRRKNLYFIKDKVMWLYILSAFLLSALMIYSLIPYEINGGLYFTIQCFDNSFHVSLANSIAANGLPPINPYITYNGELLKIYYHFGISAFAAQPVILLGVDTIVANAVSGGLAIAFVMLLSAAICTKYLDGKIFWIFLILIILTQSSQSLLEAILPSSLSKVLYPQAGYIGFFWFFSNVAFSEHTYLAATIIITVLYLYTHMINSCEKKDSIHIAIVIGLITTSIFYLSVFSGVCAAVWLVISVIILYVTKREIRLSINREIFQHILMVIVVIIFVMAYTFYILERRSLGDSSLAFGVIPAYGAKNILQIIGAFFNFYLFLLPSNVGIVIIFSYIFILFPKLLPDDLFFKIARVWIAIQLFSIFIIHSTATTNDYGWRLISVPYGVAIICGGIILQKLFILLYTKSKKCAYIMFVICSLICVVHLNPLFESLIPLVSPNGAAEHIAFKNSLPGWVEIRKHTNKNDIVMCNPTAFLGVGYQHESNNQTTFNYFSSFYAKRYLAIGDFFEPFILRIEPQTEEGIIELYNRMVSIFDGNPDSSDITFLADEQKVKALLVIPSDGLWNEEGTLLDRYKLEKEDKYYKIYVMDKA